MLYDLTITQSTRMLQNLLPILDKAAAYSDQKKFDMAILLNARLAPDQFHLIKQIQIVSDTVKLGVARLTGKEAPAWEDKEATLNDLRARIEKTITYLKSFTPNDFKGSEERKVTTPRWEGKFLTGQEFAIMHMLPNLYFHMTTAYSILRHNGVDVGKKDYLGELPFKK